MDHRDEYNLSRPTFTNSNIVFGSQDPLVNLPCVHEAQYDSAADEHKESCLIGTRAGIILNVRQWADRHNASTIFWLNGMSGTGKSTIARTVASIFDHQKVRRLGASFFFSRGAGQRGGAGLFVSTVALQLSHAVPGLKLCITESFNKNPDVIHLALREQWKQLISVPLSRMPDNSLPKSGLILVIDALDECDDQRDVATLLSCILELGNNEHIRVQAFVTSRPLRTIPAILESPTSGTVHSYRLDDVHPSFVHKDIYLYVADFFQRLKTRYGSDHFPKDWPGKISIMNLTRQAQGLFQFAATACAFIGEIDESEQRLALVLDDICVDRSPHDRLNSIYLQVLKQSLEGFLDQEKITRSEHFRTVVGSLVLLLDQLSESALVELLGVVSLVVKRTLHGLKSILYIPRAPDQPLRVLHPSFRDFLVDPARCQAAEFVIDEKQAHSQLFQRCLSVMSELLKEDICDLKLPGTSVMEISSETVAASISPALRYACRYWADHLRHCSMSSRLEQAVKDFLEQHLLCWVEVMSILRYMDVAISVLISLHESLEKGDAELAAVVADTRDFVSYNRSTIEQAPLQVYCAALLFCPRTSRVYANYSTALPKWVADGPAPETSRNPLISKVMHHGKPVEALSYSTDGTMLGSLSLLAIRVWDATTGTLLFEDNGPNVSTDDDHRSDYNHIVFSLCGKYLAGTYRTVMRVFNCYTWELVSSLEINSVSPVRAITFTPDSIAIRFVTEPGVVSDWDFTTRSCRTLWELDRALGVRVGAALISPDCSYVVMIPMYKRNLNQKLLILNLASGQLRIEERPEQEYYDPRALSPCSRFLAVYVERYSLHYLVISRLEDSSTVAQIEIHSDVASIAWLSDSLHLAATFYDPEIRVWNIDTLALVQESQFDLPRMEHIRANPTKSSLVFVTGNVSIIVVDPIMGKAGMIMNKTLPGSAQEHIRKVVFSVDEATFATYDMSQYIDIWNASTGYSQTLLGPLTSRTTDISFAHQSSKLLASISGNTVMLWDTERSVCLRTYVLPEDLQAVQVVFSPDDRYIALASRILTEHIGQYGLPLIIGLWEPITGILQRRIRISSDYGYQDFEQLLVAFSPDSSLIAVARKPGYTICLFDVLTGDLCRVLHLNGNGVSHRVGISMSFSMCGRYISIRHLDRSSIFDFGESDWIPSIDRPHFTTSRGSAFYGHEFDIGVASTRTREPGFWPSYTITPRLWIDDEWILYGSAKLLQLPPEAQRSSFAASNSRIAIGTSIGRKVILNFNLHEMPSLQSISPSSDDAPSTRAAKGGDGAECCSRVKGEEKRSCRISIFQPVGIPDHDSSGAAVVAEVSEWEAPVESDIDSEDTNGGGKVSSDVESHECDHVDYEVQEYDGDLVKFGWCYEGEWPEQRDRARKMPSGSQPEFYPDHHIYHDQGYGEVEDGGSDSSADDNPSTDGGGEQNHDSEEHHDAAQI